MEIEQITKFDFDRDADRLNLVRQVAAMINSGGGRIVLGAARHGEATGLHPEKAALIERAVVAELVDRYLRPDRVELTVERSTTAGGGVVVELGIVGAAEPPVVLASAGTYLDRSDQEQTVFGAYTVYVRHNGRTQLARRPDFVRWRSEAVDEVRRQVYERLALVVEAPQGATVRILTNDEVHDPPSYFLSRSTDLFRLRSDRLLSGQDLVQLWLSRATLRLDDTASELVVQSALRKRATLYPWLAVLPLSDEQIRRFLFGAVTMKDRDKSDAARAMLLVCALYFDEGDYSALAAAVAQSSYAHMREAVEAMPDIDAARRQLGNERAVGRGERAGAGDEPDHELLARIDDLVAAQGAGSRRLPALGLELLERKLSRRPARL